MPDVVGFIGLGRMGSVMAERLAGAGWTLQVHDVDTGAAERLVGLGDVEVQPSARAVAEHADVVVLMLPNSDAVEAVLVEAGALDALAPGKVVVDMGSSEPMRTRRLAAEAIGNGVTVMDAPVSGGVRAATAGTLTIMVGGDATTVARVRPILDELGSRVVHVGDAGAGHAVKALNNLMSATHLLATSEAMRTAEAFGLDLAVVLDVVNTSSGRSGSTENKWPNFVLPGTYDSGFALDLMVKDMAIAVALADAAGVDATLGRRALELWRDAAAMLPAGADHTEIARCVAVAAPATDADADAEGRR